MGEFTFQDHPRVRVCARYLGQNMYEFIGSRDEVQFFSCTAWQKPAFSYPICVKFTKENLKSALGTVDFDVIINDAPWKLTGSQPTRGVCIPYSLMLDAELLEIPLEQLLVKGFVLLWTINAKDLNCSKLAA